MCDVVARVHGRPVAHDKRHAWYVRPILAAVVHWHVLAPDRRMRTHANAHMRSASAPATRRRRRPQKVPWHCRLPPRWCPRHPLAHCLRSQALPLPARPPPPQRSPRRRRRPPRRWRRPARRACCRRCWDWRRALAPLQLCFQQPACLRTSNMQRSASICTVPMHACMQVHPHFAPLSILRQSGRMSCGSCAACTAFICDLRLKAMPCMSTASHETQL